MTSWPRAVRQLCERMGSLMKLRGGGGGGGGGGGRGGGGGGGGRRSRDRRIMITL